MRQLRPAPPESILPAPATSLRTSHPEIFVAGLPPRGQAAWGRGGSADPAERGALARTERSPPGPEHCGVGLVLALNLHPTTEIPAHLLA